MTIISTWLKPQCWITVRAENPKPTCKHRHKQTHTHFLYARTIKFHCSIKCEMLAVFFWVRDLKVKAEVRADCFYGTFKQRVESRFSQAFAILWRVACGTVSHSFTQIHLKTRAILGNCRHTSFSDPEITRNPLQLECCGTFVCVRASHQGKTWEDSLRFELQCSALQRRAWNCVTQHCQGHYMLTWNCLQPAGGTQDPCEKPEVVQRKETSVCNSEHHDWCWGICLTSRSGVNVVIHFLLCCLSQLPRLEWSHRPQPTDRRCSVEILKICGKSYVLLYVRLKDTLLKFLICFESFWTCSTSLGMCMTIQSASLMFWSSAGILVTSKFPFLPLRLLKKFGVKWQAKTI